jgi:hypothetical protein
MKMKSKLEKGGALLLAIALSGEVATKDASQDPYIANNVRF